MVAGSTEPVIVRSVKEINTIEKEIVDFIWDADWMAKYIEKIKPLVEKAKIDGHMVSIVLGGADKQMAMNFAKETGIIANYYNADDILLKTIVRSNPGVVLWKKGSIINKWHENKLPSYEDLKKQNLN